MSHRREVVIGRSVLGRPIEAVHVTPPSYAKPRPPVVLVGAIHGDEDVTQMMLERLADELVERPPGRDTWIVPCLNVDGALAGTRNNANDIDLERNFAGAGWGTALAPGSRPGRAPEDQPETQALVALIERVGARRLIALHAAHPRVIWSGGGEALARELADRCGYALARDGDTPGSFAARYGGDREREVITLETPYLLVDDRAWDECRTALRWCVDLFE